MAIVELGVPEEAGEDQIGAGAEERKLVEARIMSRPLLENWSWDRWSMQYRL